MFDKMKQLMEFKKQAEQIKKELGETTVEVDEGRGIKIVIDGTQNFHSLSIDPGRLQADDKQGLEADLIRHLNAAIKKSQDLAAKKMTSFLPNLGT